jgi:membrane fusion protein (multidrug efflux system)
MSSCSSFHRHSLLIMAALVTLTVSGCGKGPQQGHGGMFGGPTPVSTMTVQPEAIPEALEYAAQTDGSRDVEVRARVTGILLKRNYVEGDKVKEGESLFTIDPAPFQAALANAEAAVASAQARYDQAKREAVRLKPLIAARAVSQKEYDDAVSAQEIAAADLQGANARLKNAQLNLAYTKVESPITGVTSRSLKSEGSLVSGPDVLLTTVTQTDPMYVLFGMPDNDRLRLQREIQSGAIDMPKDGKFSVTIKLSDGSDFSHKGTINFTDVRVSTDTGTSEMRAVVPNPKGSLHPGEFVRVRLTGIVRKAAFKVPQKAIQEGPQGKFVYVVGKDNKAEVRQVEAGEWLGTDEIVTSGLKAGDQLIVDGVLKLGPGAPVQVGGAPQGAPATPAQPQAKQGG